MLVDGYTSSTKLEPERIMKPSCPDKSCPNHNQVDSPSIVKFGKDGRKIQRYHCKICKGTFISKSQAKNKACHRKKGQKGIKSMRGRPELYSEVKAKVSLSLTPTAVKGLDNLSSALNLSRSEFIERIGRELIMIEPDVASQ